MNNIFKPYIIHLDTNQYNHHLYFILFDLNLQKKMVNTLQLNFHNDKFLLQVESINFDKIFN